MLQRLFIEINEPKHVCTAFQWLTRLLIRLIRPCPTYFFADPFLTSHPPFLMTFFQGADLCTHSFKPSLLAVSARG